MERMGFALKAPSGAFIQEQRREALRLSTHNLLRARPQTGASQRQ
jgi:hypothetical protein